MKSSGVEIFAAFAAGVLEVLQKAFSDIAFSDIEAAFNVEGSAGEQYIYVAAVHDTSEYARVLTPEGDPIEGDHLVLGAQGAGSSYTYVAVPVLSVEKEGRFLLGPRDVADLKKWAGEVGGSVPQARFQHERRRGYRLVIEDEGRVSLDIDVSYESFDIDEIFRSLRFEFRQPEVDVTEEEAFQALLKNADTMAHQMGAARVRVGDLTFYGSGVEFAAYDEQGHNGISTSQRAPIDTGFQFSWDATPALLKMLSRASKQNGCRIGYTPDQGQIPGQHGEFQIAYEAPVKGGRKLYVQREALRATSGRCDPK